MRKILKYTDAVFTASRHNADCSANFKILIFFFLKFLEKFNLLSKSFMFLFILFSLVSILKLYFSCLNP